MYGPTDGLRAPVKELFESVDDELVMTVEWRAFIQALDVGSLVPEAYAAYRPVLVDAFRFFLEGLGRRAGEIMSAQERLPRSASRVQRLVRVLHQCPTLHKLGQVVARDKRLAPDLRQLLQRLESMQPRTPVQDVRAIIERELPDLGACGVKLGTAALAEASVAVVLPCAWHDGGAGDGRAGVLKVLKPGVQERMEEELTVWSDLGGLLDERSAAYGLPAIDYGETLDRTGELLVNEVRLEHEQAHLAEAAAQYADFDRVHVPAVWPFCTPQVTAMERIDGCKVTSCQGMSETGRRRLADTMVEALIACPMWNRSPSPLFHADPHAGNLFVDGEGRLGMLDWSLAGRLDKEKRIALTQMVLGGVTLDGHRVERALAGLAAGLADHKALQRVVAEAIRRVRSGMRPGFDWLVGTLDDAVRVAGVQLGTDLLMFRKAVLTLDGVVADVWSACDVDVALGAAALRRFAGEQIERALVWPLSRDLGTHISNTDALSLFWSGPATAARWWISTWHDCVGALG